MAEQKVDQREVAKIKASLARDGRARTERRFGATSPEMQRAEADKKNLAQARATIIKNHEHEQEQTMSTSTNQKTQTPAQQRAQAQQGTMNETQKKVAAARRHQARLAEQAKGQEQSQSRGQGM